jgi:hypothetical protein
MPIRCSAGAPLQEESNEFGGTFICNGIERIIRMLVQQRRHYIMALRRGAYHKRGPAFTEMATLIRWGPLAGRRLWQRGDRTRRRCSSSSLWFLRLRHRPSTFSPGLPRSCVRPDESSMTNRCHYLVDGSCVFALTIRRAGEGPAQPRLPASHVPPFASQPAGIKIARAALERSLRAVATLFIPTYIPSRLPTRIPPPPPASEYFIPAGILLKCFLEVSDREMYDKLVGSVAPGTAHAAFVAERAELLLRQAKQFGLHTR